METILQLIDLTKSFDHTPVVNRVNLQIQSGEFFTFLGPSGCGKTTTLRMIAGFEQPTSGRIILDKQEITNLPPYKRDVNTVFQNYALFPHLTVFENIAFGLEMRKEPKEEIARRVGTILETFHLTGLEKRKPSQLSGGQQQRVAVARSLVLHPRVLLLDEPLAALDAKLRRQIQIELKEIQKNSGVTFLYVTHDQEEALTLSDRVAVMRNGILEQVGTPRDIYLNPATRFVAEFVGENNLLPARIVKQTINELLIDISGVTVKAAGSAPAGPATLAVRPEYISLTQTPPDTPNAFPGTIRETLYSGASLKTVIQLDTGDTLLALVPPGSPFTLGQRVWASWHPSHSTVLPDEGGRGE